MSKNEGRKSQVGNLYKSLSKSNSSRQESKKSWN